MKKKLVYIMDPQCGWCYANERSIKDVASSIPNDYELEILAGGMWRGHDAPRGSSAMHDYLIPSIIRINQFYDCEISKGYVELIQDPTYLLSSEFASQAILAMGELAPEEQLNFSYDLMKMQFQEGKRYDVEKNYRELIKNYPVDEESFIDLWKSDEIKQKSQAMYERASRLTKGYPSLVLEHDNGYSVIKRGVFEASEVLNALDKWEGNSSNSSTYCKV